MSLPRGYRLTRSRDIVQVREKGAKLNAGPYLAFFCRREESPEGPARLCVVTSRRVGNAVERNRARRRMKALFYGSRKEIPTGMDVVIIARRSLPKHPQEDLVRRFAKTVRRMQAMGPTSQD